jgi:hypothetical protein
MIGVRGGNGGSGDDVGDVGVKGRSTFWLWVAAIAACSALGSRASAQQGSDALGSPRPDGVSAEEVPVPPPPEPPPPADVEVRITTEDPGAEALPEAPRSSRRLGAPAAASELSPVELAQAEEALARFESEIAEDRVTTVGLYVGGVLMTIGAVALLASAILKAACVSEEIGCFDASEYVVAGIPAAVIGTVILSGATVTDQRVQWRERAAEQLRDDLAQQRGTRADRVVLQVGAGSLSLRVSF